MSVQQAVQLRPITRADVRDVAQFLHSQLNQRISAEAWAAAIIPPWSVSAPNHGFMLRTELGIVGAYLAFYSDRVVDGETVRMCNLAAWCVDADHRTHGFRLVRALLAQKGYQFTDLSPSGNVVPLNTRLKFCTLDTSTALVPNLPWPLWSRQTRVVSAPAAIEQLLKGRDLTIYNDHAGAAAARHLVVQRGDEICYVMFRRDRRKDLPLFASILYVGNPAMFSRVDRHVFRHLLLRQGILVTLAERRVVGGRPRLSFAQRSPRSKMFKSDCLRADQIDYLYSELACVAW